MVKLITTPLLELFSYMSGYSSTANAFPSEQSNSDQSAICTSDDDDDSDFVDKTVYEDEEHPLIWPPAADTRISRVLSDFKSLVNSSFHIYCNNNTGNSMNERHISVASRSPSSRSSPQPTICPCDAASVSAHMAVIVILQVLSLPIFFATNGYILKRFFVLVTLSMRPERYPPFSVVSLRHYAELVQKRRFAA